MRLGHVEVHTSSHGRLSLRLRQCLILHLDMYLYLALTLWNRGRDIAARVHE